MDLSQVIIDIAAGPFGSNLKVECFVQSGFPIIDGANLKGFKVTDNITKFVTEEKAQSLHRSIAHRGDVVVTISGTIGQIAYIPENSKYEAYLVSQRQFRVTFDRTKVFVPYLVYYFHTEQGQHQILSFANQTGVPALSQPLKNFKKISIDLPSIEKQRRIAGILGSLDDKIELNRRINANLEAQAQAFFKSWFVDFEPFRDGPFVDSELGKIPKGWRIGTIDEIIQILSGYAFKSETFTETGPYRLVTIKNVQDGSLNIDGAVYVSEIPDKMPQHCHLDIGDILLSLTGNVGRVCIVDRDGLLLNQRVAKLHPKDKRNTFFTYALFRQDSFKQYLIQIAKGTAQLNLSPVETGNMKIVLANQDILLQFCEIGQPIFDNIILNCMEIITLSTMRDTLLPKLMAGELL